MSYLQVNNEYILDNDGSLIWVGPGPEPVGEGGLKCIVNSKLLSVTADSEDTNYPIENITDGHPASPWKADNTYKARLIAYVSEGAQAIGIGGTNAESVLMYIRDPNEVYFGEEEMMALSGSASPSSSPSEGTPSTSPSGTPIEGTPSNSPSGSPSAGSPSGSPSSSPSGGTPSNSPSEGTPSSSPSEGTPSSSPSSSPSGGQSPSSSPSEGTPSVSPTEGTPSGSPSNSPSAGTPITGEDSYFLDGSYFIRNDTQLSPEIYVSGEDNCIVGELGTTLTTSAQIIINLYTSTSSILKAGHLDIGDLVEVGMNPKQGLIRTGKDFSVSHQLSSGARWTLKLNNVRIFRGACQVNIHNQFYAFMDDIARTIGPEPRFWWVTDLPGSKWMVFAHIENWPVGSYDADNYGTVNFELVEDL